ncbi:hypothetical protein GCM10010353_45480 [Streptomyces chryseus]|nr:hypothetical protein GCM10010353_45480 [Streptomyces chryseus]
MWQPPDVRPFVERYREPVVEVQDREQEAGGHPPWRTPPEASARRHGPRPVSPELASTRGMRKLADPISRLPENSVAVRQGRTAKPLG